MILSKAAIHYRRWRAPPSYRRSLSPLNRESEGTRCYWLATRIIAIIIAVYNFILDKSEVEATIASEVFSTVTTLFILRHTSYGSTRGEFSNSPKGLERSACIFLFLSQSRNSRALRHVCAKIFGGLSYLRVAEFPPSLSIPAATALKRFYQKSCRTEISCD